MDSLLNSDTFTSIVANRNAGTRQRKWIEYADGMLEPVRRDANLNKKYHGDRRKLDWWTVQKPVDWLPSDEGRKATLNHDYRRPGKPKDEPKSGVLGLSKDADKHKGAQTDFLRDMGKGKGESMRMAEKGATSKGGKNQKPAPRTTLLRGAEAYQEIEAQRQAAKAESKDKGPGPNVHRGEVKKSPSQAPLPSTESNNDDSKAASEANIRKELTSSILDELKIQFGGEGRSLFDGPRYGNYGGKKHTGGSDGDKHPMDSSDRMYKQHDYGWDECS